MSGDARGAAYATLGQESSGRGPLDAVHQPEPRILVGETVGCYSFQPVLGTTNLVAVCLK